MVPVASADEPLQIARARRRIARVEAYDAWDWLQQVVCEPARLRIIAALDGAQLTVSALAAAIGRKVPATSQHLRRLRELQLVEGERQGATVAYRLRPGAAAEQLQAMLTTLEQPPPTASEPS
jgi:DNA-binding transcriptional ArsR family regulator